LKKVMWSALAVRGDGRTQTCSDVVTLVAIISHICSVKDTEIRTCVSLCTEYSCSNCCGCVGVWSCCQSMV